MRKRKISNGVLFVILAVFLYLAVHLPMYLSKDWWNRSYAPISTPTIAPAFVTGDLTGLKFEWQRLNFSPRNWYYSPALQAKNGRVFFLEDSHIRGLNIRDGSAFIQTDPHLNAELAFIVDDSSLYVNSFQSVVKIDLATGQELWKQDLDGVKVAERFAIVNDELQTDWSPWDYYVLSIKDGKVLRANQKSDSVLREEGGIIYSGPGYVLDAKQTNGSVLWKRSFTEQYRQQPVFTPGIIYVWTEDGKAFAIDREKGLVIWQVDDHVVSNLALLGNRVYYLVDNGQLFGANAQTGKIEKSVAFSGRDFYSPGYCYSVAGDETTHFLAVYIQKSKQLVAFSEQK